MWELSSLDPFFGATLISGSFSLLHRKEEIKNKTLPVKK